MMIALHAPPRGMAPSVDALAEHILKTQADLFVGPEYFLQNRTLEKRYNGHVDLFPITKSRRDDFVGSLCEKTKDVDALIVPGSIMWHAPSGHCYNSAPVIHKGEIITERFKENEANSDTIMAEAVGTRFATQTSNPLLVHNGLSYRLDICLDGFLQADEGEYDIHIVICSRMVEDLFLRSCPRPRRNGIFILVDNKENEQERRLGIALNTPSSTTRREYRMPLAVQSYEHTDMFEVDV